MRIALIADLHGNLTALEAVIADLTEAGVDQVVCLGDVAAWSIPEAPDCPMSSGAMMPAICRGQSTASWTGGQDLQDSWESNSDVYPSTWTWSCARPPRAECRMP